MEVDNLEGGSFPAPVRTWVACALIPVTGFWVLTSSRGTEPHYNGTLGISRENQS